MYCVYERFGSSRQMTNTPQSIIIILLVKSIIPLQKPFQKPFSNQFKKTQRSVNNTLKKKAFSSEFLLNLYYLTRLKLYQDKEKKKEQSTGSEGKRSGASLFNNTGVCDTERRLLQRRATQTSTEFCSQNW